MTRWLILSILLTLAAFGGSLYVYEFEYDRLPERVPIHWNIRGEPDGWVSKHDVIWTFLLMPAVMAGTIVLTAILPWLSPKPFDVERFRDTYGYLMALVVALFGFIHFLVLFGSLEPPGTFDLGRWLVGGIFLLFALIGNVLGRTRRNFWIGVRTPWTLASETVWIQTHRLTAWLFVLIGIAGFAAVVAGVPLVWCFAAFMTVAVFVPVLYSLALYKRLERQGRL
jgi:uncharacterized membrane protein